MTGADAILDPFALLDDDDATAARAASRLYTGFVREHRCVDPSTLDAVCEAAQADLDAGLHAVLLADYEWGAKLLGAGLARVHADDRSCLRLLMFDTLRHLDAEAVAGWLAQCEGRPEPTPAGVLDLNASIDPQSFEHAIGRIHEAIRDGETYQVNYTYRMHGRAWGSPVALYRRLRARQRVNFGALMRLPMHSGDDVEWVLSRSPELFVRHERGLLQARPMKGTAPRSGAPESDSEIARLLQEDVKNRAENLMIVDLLRNDLGRIAELGSVKVPELFRVEPYATVFQMTSTIEARRRESVGMAQVLRALFPCGSITGAPKHRTMEWIAQLESEPRGLYTGAIGWVEEVGESGATPNNTCPDFTLSVAIRTITLGPADSFATHPLTLGVGGGIVLDSIPADEYDETLWKARFLTAIDPGVELFETMRATREGVPLRHRHRDRLLRSARSLGFAFDPLAFDAALDGAVETLPSDAPHRLRIALRFDGRLSTTVAPLLPLPPGPLRVLLADDPLPAARPLATHKTTLRAAYDAGIRRAEGAGAFDTLFFGSEGQLLEGGRSNVFLRIGGLWFTPPLEDGVLPGVMRSVLLDNPSWNVIECRLTRSDLERAEEIAVCNALRGALTVNVASLFEKA
ncbi:MAG TPA: aminodeoxychorismate synthase component I [Burkholderiaceae bacterium]|nr:aminodeoxychorismate synthase component I [Burkholderiaceae bacterium]